MEYFIFSALINFALSASDFVTVYTRPQFTGHFTNISLTSICVPSLESLDPKLEDGIESINSQSNCVQLYSDFNCSGKYLVVKPGTPSHENLHYYGLSARSLGPCYEDCHPDKIEGEREIVKVEISGEREGHETERRVETHHLTLNAFNCTDISSQFALFSPSKDFTVMIPFGGCVELHEFQNCTGSIQFLSVGPLSTADAITYYADHSKSKSISLCGYNCEGREAIIANRSKTKPNKTSPSSNDKNKNFENEIQVALFPFPEFAGEPTRLVLSSEGNCVIVPRQNFVDEYSTQGGNVQKLRVQSALAYSLNWTTDKYTEMHRCIVLYSGDSCKETSLLYVIRQGMDPDIVYESGKKARSLKLCDESHNFEGKAEKCFGSSGGSTIVVITCICFALAFFGAGFWFVKRKRNLEHNRNQNVTSSSCNCAKFKNNCKADEKLKVEGFEPLPNSLHSPLIDVSNA